MADTLNTFHNRLCSGIIVVTDVNSADLFSVEYSTTFVATISVRSVTLNLANFSEVAK